MARLNISVPDELKLRMDKHQGVNWSQTACELFERKINEIESSIEVLDMKSAISRLKASKAIFNDANKKSGYQQGIEWAMQEAEWDELLRIEDANEKQDIPSTLKELCNLISGGNYEMDDLLENGIDNKEFIDGFLEAALEVKEKADK